MPRLACALLVSLAACALPPPAPRQAPEARPSSRSGDRAWTPIQLGLTEDHQLFDERTSVAGLRFDLWSGHNRAVYGLDVNLGIGHTGGGGGVATSLVWNNAADDFWGAQLSLVINSVQGRKDSEREERMGGAQVALIANDARESYGLQVGAMNIAARAYGLQIAAANAASRLDGLQTGLWNTVTAGAGAQLAVHNRADGLDGVQIGLWNHAESGLQIGLLNFNESGFLPFFPLLNF